MDYDFASVIEQAFAAWSKYGDIEFKQVADKGGAAGQGKDADIRIFFGEIPGGTAGYAFYPSAFGSAIAGDILLDTIDRFANDPDMFLAVVTHEIGHSLGLGHVDGNSIMTPVVRKIGLQADDIAGIQQIYGVQDGAPNNDGNTGEDTPPPPPPPDDNHDDDHDHDHDHDGHSHDPDADHNDPNDQILSGTGGADTINGRDGDDTINGKGGNDRLNGGADNDDIDGGRGNDRVIGQNGDDHVKGAGGRDVVIGGSGEDTLEGGNGDDKLKGGWGDDIIIGGANNDYLKGGLNSDTFVFANGHGRDTIADFNAKSSAEKIDLSDVSGFNNFRDVQDALTKVGTGVLIETGSNSSIMLNRVNINDLDAGDFLF